MNLKEKILEFRFIKTASEVADKMNVEAFIVGGVVRDIILERENNDIDILVIGSGPEFAKYVSERYKLT